MSNFWLKDPDCLFIHIPKTGGSTIRRGLWSGRYEGPAFGKFEEDWPKLYSFAFVRHPLDRFVSAYCDFTQIRNFQISIEDFADIVMDDSIVYDETRSNRKERVRHHCIPQTHAFNCLTLAQDIYRFEDFEEEVQRLGAKVGHNFDHVPRRRKTKHGGWYRYLDIGLILRLTEFYEQDFVELGYETI